MKRFWMILTVLTVAMLAALALPLAAAAATVAGNCNGDHTVFGDSYTLASGQQLDSNLIVLGGNATIAPGATVNCKVVLLGGNLDLGGTVQSDVVIFGGAASLRSSSEIDGQLQILGGTYSQDNGAQIRGGVSQGFSNNSGGGSGPFPAGRDIPVLAAVVGFYRTVTRTVLGSLGLGLLALLVVLVWPQPTLRVRAAIGNAPGQTGALGLLTLVAVPVLIIIATITICLIPVAFMAMVVFTAALAFGWIAIGALVGERLVKGLRLTNLSPAVAAALGTTLLSLVLSIIGWVPCVGWVAPVILAAVGLGAVTLTRFGTQPYFPASPAVPPAVPPTEPALNG